MASERELHPHDWPWIWIAHAERREIEVLRRDGASVTYRPGADVPLVPELDEHGLVAVPASAFFDKREADRFTGEWVRARGEARGLARGRAQAIASVLAARGLSLPDEALARIAATTDLARLDRWLGIAATCASADALLKALG